MKQWIIFMILILLSSSALAIDTDMNILKSTCGSDGRLKLLVDSTEYVIDSDSIEAKAIFQEDEDEEEIPAFYFPLKASADEINSEENVTLESNEAVFNWSGMYRLTISYDKEGEIIKFPHTIVCPGLSFSCKTAKLEIKECSNENDVFKADVFAEGLEILEGTDAIESVEFLLEAKNSYEDINGETSVIGSLAKGFTTTNEGEGIYSISGEFTDNEVIAFTASFKYNDCERVSEKSCIEQKVEEVVSTVTGAATTEITGEMALELERKRQEVAESIQKNLEEYESGWSKFIKWGLFICIISGVLCISMYILIKRKANKKPNFVKF